MRWCWVRAQVLLPWGLLGGGSGSWWGWWGWEWGAAVVPCAAAGSLSLKLFQLLLLQRLVPEA